MYRNAVAQCLFLLFFSWSEVFSNSSSGWISLFCICLQTKNKQNFCPIQINKFIRGEVSHLLFFATDKKDYQIFSKSNWPKSLQVIKFEIYTYFWLVTSSTFERKSICLIVSSTKVGMWLRKLIHFLCTDYMWHWCVK